MAFTEKMIIKRDQNYPSILFIEVHSSSGNTYRITKNSCNCKGFSFRRNCRHFQEAINNKALDRLAELQEKVRSESISSSFTSPLIVACRKRAIIAYLNKLRIPFQYNLIDKLEKVLTQTMNPTSFLSYVKKFSN